MAGSRRAVKVRAGRAAHVPLRVGVVGVTVIAVAVLGLQNASGADEEGAVLEVVQVDVAPNGDISTVSTTDLRREAGDTRSGEERQHDPAKVADRIPVRLQTTYRMGDAVGTDLRDIEGRRGRVHVDVTVQNTSVRPTNVSYEVEGSSRSTPALVGVPLTVAASAALRGTGLADVVVGKDGTNGTVADVGDGPTVQWAAMLAPPRLSPSTTFSMVFDTDDFEVPDIDITVQPGLTTDPSQAAAEGRAFGRDGGTSVATVRTVKVLGSVGSALGDAGAVLERTRVELDRTSHDGVVDGEEVADLVDRSAQVQQVLGSLDGELDSLQPAVVGAISDSEGAAVKQLTTALTQISDQIGGPDEVRSATNRSASTATGCVAAAEGDGGSTTLYEQMRELHDRLGVLQTTTTSCVDEVVGSLSQFVGQADRGCQPSQPTALSSIACASDALASSAADLAQLGDDLDTTVDEGLVDDVRTAFSSFTTALDSARAEARQLASGSVDDDTTQLQLKLQLALRELGLAGGGLADLGERADAQLALLEGDRGAIRQTNAVVGLVCSTLAGQPAAESASRLLQGTSCDGEPGLTDGYDSSLLDKLDADAAAWQHVRDEVRGGSGGLQVDVAEARAEVADVYERLDDVRQAGTAAGLQQGVEGLTRRLDALGAVGSGARRTLTSRSQPDPLESLSTRISDLDRVLEKAKENQEAVDQSRDDLDRRRAEREKDRGDLMNRADELEDKAAARMASAVLNLVLTSVSSAVQLGSHLAGTSSRLGSAAKQYGVDREASTEDLAESMRTIFNRFRADAETTNHQLVDELRNLVLTSASSLTRSADLASGAPTALAASPDVTAARRLSTSLASDQQSVLDRSRQQDAQVEASLDQVGSLRPVDRERSETARSRTMYVVHLGED